MNDFKKWISKVPLNEQFLYHHHPSKNKRLDGISTTNIVESNQMMMKKTNVRTSHPGAALKLFV